MYRIIALLLLATLTTGCVQPLIKECEGSNGKDVTIKYGDSYIDVTYKVKVKQDEKIVLKLMPQNNPESKVDYETLDIHLIGATAKDQWLNRTLSAKEGGAKKVICVGDEKTGDYKYIVEVPGVGRIDPRVVVDPR
jgi:hypothetical protein